MWWLDHHSCNPDINKNGNHLMYPVEPSSPCLLQEYIQILMYNRNPQDICSIKITSIVLKLISYLIKCIIINSLRVKCNLGYTQQYMGSIKGMYTVEYNDNYCSYN